MDDLNGRRVTVAGLGRFGGGIAVARWLVAQGAQVLVTDRESEEKLADSKQKLAGLPIKFRFGEHRTEDFVSADLVVASPAIPLSSLHLAAARAAGKPITTEIKLFLQRCPARRIIGITGTKGKSTTTAMLARVLKTRFTTWTGGNIGGSLLADLPKIKPDDLVVLELSSYMLEHLRDMRWSPHVAIVTLIALDHLEWHGGPEAYIAAKRVLVESQKADDFTILPRGDEAAREFELHTRGQIRLFPLAGSRPFELMLPGAHNQLNAQAAYAAAACFGISWAQTQEALRHFSGLPHRLQIVHRADGIVWVNDSIATIPEAAEAALASFAPRTVIQIIGGYDKQLDMSSMCRTLAGQAKAVICIGAIGLKLADAIRSSPQPLAAVERCDDLPAAVARARALAVAGDTILLSPGCASYDQFVNFEQRGDVFAALAVST